jgi:predicted MFS family arabinose efflux permease
LVPPVTPSTSHPPDGPPASRGGAGHRLGAALLSRDFRLLWGGAFLSTVGTWMQKVAQSWLVLSLTGSAWYLGLDAFLGELPLLLFTLIGGVIADRYNRRRLLIGSQIVQLLSAGTLAVITFSGVVQVWHVLLLSFLTGCAQAFGGPAHQSLLPSLVPRQHLPNAIALNSIQFNLSRLIGPVLAGIVIATFGTAAVFGLNALSYLAVVAALVAISARHVPPRGAGSLVQQLQGGLRHVRRDRTLTSLIAIAFLSALLGLPLQTFLPVVAQEIFGQGVAEYSRLMAWSGGGAVAGALVVAWMGRYRGMGRAVLILQALFAVLIIGIAWSRTLPLTYLLLVLGGAAGIMTTSLVTSLVQLVAPDELRGRVLSIYMVAFRGGMPLGSLVSGALIASLGITTVLTINGALLCLAAVWFLARRGGVTEI